MAPEIAVDVGDAADGIERGTSDSHDSERVPLEVLERNLTTYAAHIAAAEAQWLIWLGEYDERLGWGAWGCSGPVQWLQWRCGLSPSTARDKVRVAKALRDLPTITAIFRAGRITYSKVRAITRVATADNEAYLGELAVLATGAQLDKIVREYASAIDAQSEPPSAWALRGFTRRTVSKDTEDGLVEYKIRLQEHVADRFGTRVNNEVNAIINDALGRRPETTTRSDFIEERGGYGALCADAVTAIVEGTALTSTTNSTGSSVTTPTDVTLIVNDSAHRHHTECTCLCASAEAAQVDQSDSSSSTVRASAEAAGLDSSASASRASAEAATTDQSANAIRASAEAATTDQSANAIRASAEAAEVDQSDSCTSTVRASAEAAELDQSASAASTSRASAEAVGLEFLQNQTVLPRAAGYRLCCDPRITALVEDATNNPIGAGRSTRLVNRKLRRALERRDQHTCQHPGCNAKRNLHAHHIIHWANGGPTELANLILVCTFHHHLVHEGGWNVNPKTHRFHKPDGTPVDPGPDRSRGSATQTLTCATFTTPAPLAEATAEPFDLGLTIETLCDLTPSWQSAHKWQPTSELDPPLPGHVKHQRLIQAAKHLD